MLRIRVAPRNAIRFARTPVLRALAARGLSFTRDTVSLSEPSSSESEKKLDDIDDDEESDYGECTSTLFNLKPAGRSVAADQEDVHAMVASFHQLLGHRDRLSSAMGLLERLLRRDVPSGLEDFYRDQVELCAKSLSLVLEGEQMHLLLERLIAMLQGSEVRLLIRLSFHEYDAALCASTRCLPCSTDGCSMCTCERAWTKGPDGSGRFVSA